MCETGEEAFGKEVAGRVLVWDVAVDIERKRQVGRDASAKKAR